MAHVMTNTVAAYQYMRNAHGMATNEAVVIDGSATTLTRSPDDRQRIRSLSIDGKLQTTYGYGLGNRIETITNTYDYMSRRVMKITPEATHTFIYDGWNLIQETVATVSGVTTNAYVWGNDLSETRQGAGGVEGPGKLWDKYFVQC